jgi:hypothetical protein
MPEWREIFEAEDSDFGGGAWVPMQPPRALAVAVLTVASQKAGRRARKGRDHAGTAFARLKRRREKVIASACRWPSGAAGAPTRPLPQHL